MCILKITIKRLAKLMKTVLFLSIECLINFNLKLLFEKVRFENVYFENHN